MLRAGLKPAVRNAALKFMSANYINHRTRQLRPFLLAFLLFVMAAGTQASPVECGEIIFMLKHGLNSAELAADVKKRKLTAEPTAAQLADLKRLGASPELMSAVSAPENRLAQKEEASYLHEKELSKAEHFRVVGTVNGVKNGEMLVSCPGPLLKTSPPVQFIGVLILTGTLPTMFKLRNPTDPDAVNCEARQVGVRQFQTGENKVESVPVMEVVHDYGKPVLPAQTEAAAPESTPPQRQQIVLEQSKWYHLSDPKILPGGGPNVWISLAGADQFSVNLQLSQKGPELLAPRVKFAIKKGSDYNGQNLTLVCMDDNWNVYWKDSVAAFPNTGIFVIDHR